MIGAVNIISVGGDKLVERMAYIAVAYVHYRREGVLYLACFLIDRKNHICLVIVSVVRLIHGVAGVDIKLSVGLGHSQRTRAERLKGIDPLDFCISEAVPVFVVFYNPKHLELVGFITVILTENKEVVVFTAEVSSEKRKLRVDCFCFKAIAQARVVPFYRYLSPAVGYSGIISVFKLTQIRVNGAAPYAVIVVVKIVRKAVLRFCNDQSLG